MYCPTCGNQVKPEYNNCPNCGSALNNIQQPTTPTMPVQSTQPTTPQTTFDSTNKPITAHDVYTSTIQTMASPVDNENALLVEYIGPNYDGLTNGKFSWCTFLFGPLYALYRKMWVLGAAWYIVVVIVRILFGNISFIVELLASIILGTMFKERYLKKATEKINEIKTQNPTATTEELTQKCKKAGGVSFAPVIVIAVYFLLEYLVK